MRRFDVIGIGALTVDVFVETPYFFTEFKGGSKESYIVLPTFKILSKVTMRSGGSSGNIVAYLSKLKLRCSYFTKLGSDTLSMFLLKDLQSFGVDITKIIIERGLECGKSVIVSATGMKDHALVVDHGSADKLTKKDFKQNLDYLLSTEWIVATSLTSKSSVSGLRFLFKEAKKSGVKIFFAPSRTMISSFREDVLELMKFADLLAMNKGELMLLSSKPELQKALKWLKKHKKDSLVTMGKDGMVALWEGSFYRIKTYPVKSVKNTTGAGDVAATWFFYGKLKGWSVSKTLNFAAYAASRHVCSKYVGAKEGLPSLSQVSKALSKIRDLPVRRFNV